MKAYESSEIDEESDEEDKVSRAWDIYCNKPDLLRSGLVLSSTSRS
jgi:hypothetical protein